MAYPVGSLTVVFLPPTSSTLIDISGRGGLRPGEDPSGSWQHRRKTGNQRSVIEEFPWLNSKNASAPFPATVAMTEMFNSRELRAAKSRVNNQWRPVAMQRPVVTGAPCLWIGGGRHAPRHAKNRHVSSLRTRTSVIVETVTRGDFILGCYIISCSLR